MADRHVGRQEAQAHGLVEEEGGAVQQAPQPGAAAGAALTLRPRLEQHEGHQRCGQAHAEPRAGHQGELPEDVDQEVKVQHKSGSRGHRDKKEEEGESVLCIRQAI